MSASATQGAAINSSIRYSAYEFILALYYTVSDISEILAENRRF